MKNSFVTQPKCAIVGAGPMGLMATTELLDLGHQVDIYERDDRIGGMSADFDFGGSRIERYYHFICKTDHPLLELPERYGMSDKLRWVDTQHGLLLQWKTIPMGHARRFAHVSRAWADQQVLICVARDVYTGDQGLERWERNPSPGILVRHGEHRGSRRSSSACAWHSGTFPQSVWTSTWKRRHTRSASSCPSLQVT
jgi:hypothetical protein